MNAVAGGYWVNITGDGFGTEPLDVIGATVGGVASPVARWISSSLVMAQVPPGTGTDLPVVIQRRDGARSDPGTFSYQSLEVVQVEPPYLLAGVGNVSVRIIGSNLGVETADISDMQVGGYECRPFELQSSTSARCNLTDVDNWFRSEVQITTKFGRTFQFDQVFTGLSAPVVSYVEPSVALAGDTVTVFGRDFTWPGSPDQ